MNTHAGKPIVVWMLCQRLETSDVAFVLFQTSPLVMDKILSLSNLCRASFLYQKKKKKLKLKTKIKNRKEVNKLFIPNICFFFIIEKFIYFLID